MGSRRGPATDVRHHCRRRHRPHRIRGRRGRPLRCEQSLRHRTHRRPRVIGLHADGHLGPARLARLRNLVLPRRRGRPAGRRGIGEPEEGHAARHHHGNGRARRLRRPHAPPRPRTRRRLGDGGIGQSAARSPTHDLRRELRPRDLRQLGGPGRTHRELLLDHLRLLSSALRPLARRLLAQMAVPDGQTQDPGPRPHRPRHHRLHPRDRRRRQRRSPPQRPRSSVPRSPTSCSTSPTSACASKNPICPAATARRRRHHLHRPRPRSSSPSSSTSSIGVFLIALAYFWFYSRHHLVASAPEEEFAQIEAAEKGLK
jgi:hypothetical protein